MLRSAPEEYQRGALTRLTKRELHAKLAQVPVFVVRDGNGAIVISDADTGSIFFSKRDADENAKIAKPAKVSATTFDELYFSLVAKKDKPSVYEGIVAKSNPSATYKLVAPSSTCSDIPVEWKATHSENDVPLYRVSNLAFEDPAGLILPLFINKADAVSSFDRLQTSKAKAEGAAEVKKSPEILTTSILDLINLFQTGGFESRAFEIFPDVDTIREAKEMMNR